MKFCSICTFRGDQDLIVSLQPIKLHTFKHQLGVEAIRIVLRKSGVIFEDIIHSSNTWEYDSEQLSQKDLPILCLTDVHLSQYAGRISQLIPKNLIDKGIGDTIMHILHGIIMDCNLVWAASNKNKNELIKSCWGITQKRLIQLNDYIHKYKKLYVAGNSLSIADIYLYTTLRELKWVLPDLKNYLNKSLPCIQSIFDKLDKELSE